MTVTARIGNALPGSMLPLAIAPQQDKCDHIRRPPRDLLHGVPGDAYPGVPFGSEQADLFRQVAPISSSLCCPAGARPELDSPFTKSGAPRYDKTRTHGGDGNRP